MPNEMNRLLAVARGQVVEGNSRIQCDRFGFFLLTYSCTTGHLDTDFFRSGTSTKELIIL